MRQAATGGLFKFLRTLFDAGCMICGKAAGGNEICAKCQSQIKQTSWGVSSLSIDGRRIQVLWRERYDGPLTQVIHRAKFFGQWSGARALGKCLGEAPYLWAGAKPVLVPIALTGSRLGNRGYNQAAMIASTLGQAWGLTAKPRWLEKIRATPRQLKLTKASRESNLAQSFLAKPQVNGQRIILVDDVMTTGATLREAGRAIYAAGGIVVGAAVIARSGGQRIGMGHNGNRHERIQCRPRRA